MMNLLSGDTTALRESLLEEMNAHLETKTCLAARDEMLSLVSHDLRNPMTAISMGVEILEEKLSASGSTSAEFAQILGVLKRNLTDMNRLITDLSDVERLDEKQSIKLNPTNISVDAFPMGREVEFVISDSGSGGPLEEPFKLLQRLSQLMKRNRKVLGLGLYISKWIVEAHGGRFSIKTQTDQGSTYSFTVPLCH